MAEIVSGIIGQGIAFHRPGRLPLEITLSLLALSGKRLNLISQRDLLEIAQIISGMLIWSAIVLRAISVKPRTQLKLLV